MAKCKPLTDHHIVSEPYNPEGIWSPAITARFVKLWTQDGLSAGAIADDLTEILNRPVSRSCVSGKIARMGLCGKGKRQQSTGRPHGVKNGERAGVERRAPPRPPEPRVVALFPRPIEPQQPAATGIPLHELGLFQCRYALTDHSPHLFCGEATTASRNDPHGSWCEAHRARVFQPRQERVNVTPTKLKGNERTGIWR
ncbi:hypothetical protein HCU64_06635 [Methylobacterium sp. C25]|uniref:GcrA family cell cycle regulator n=1 Tax=Methylobacterium sp. C25 TaxID=2721622 RepID=UPI001F3DBEAF|nr:GcrA family cell cycle regulator [Methylobacterium sp. C25]MCE4223422.1 hypothetical protein [Methylobacterium sp. C25]